MWLFNACNSYLLYLVTNSSPKLLAMKKFILLMTVSSCVLVTKLYAQVGIGTLTPNASAMLDINSSNKGLLVPRVNLISLTDAVTIVNPLTMVTASVSVQHKRCINRW